MSVQRKHRISKRRRATASGLVNFYIHGHRDAKANELNGESFEGASIIAIIRRGLPVKELSLLQRSLDLPIEKLAPKLGISRATLHRRKARGVLGPHESDRVVRFARLLGKALEVFETEENARRWLQSPQVG